jgi:hypothetical protein
VNRSSSLRALIAVAAAAVVPLALMVPVVQGAGGGSTPQALGYNPTRAGGQPVPTVPATVSEAVDEWAEYQGQTSCTPAAKPGALKLAAVLRATYGPADIGISRDCGDGGQSEHKEGRALDWMLSYKKPAERAKVEAFLWWLMKPDAAGNAGANARRLGVMYIGWHDRIWRSYAPQNGWTELKGCYSTPSASYDTYCHRDHAHLTLSWDAAAGRTSFWDNTAELRETCDEPSVGAVAQKTGPGTAVTPVKSWLALATGRGVGSSCCRLWDPRQPVGTPAGAVVTRIIGGPVASARHHHRRHRAGPPTCAPTWPRWFNRRPHQADSTRPHPAPPQTRRRLRPLDIDLVRGGAVPGTPIVPGSKNAAVTQRAKALLARPGSPPGITAGTAAFAPTAARRSGDPGLPSEPALGKAADIGPDVRHPHLIAKR